MAASIKHRCQDLLQYRTRQHVHIMQISVLQLQPQLSCSQCSQHPWGLAGKQGARKVGQRCQGLIGASKANHHPGICSVSDDPLHPISGNALEPRQCWMPTALSVIAAGLLAAFLLKARERRSAGKSHAHLLYDARTSCLLWSLKLIFLIKANVRTSAKKP
jgi:hypothetical protein